jgi:hypothetical protein
MTETEKTKVALNNLDATEALASKVMGWKECDRGHQVATYPHFTTSFNSIQLYRKEEFTAEPWNPLLYPEDSMELLQKLVDTSGEISIWRHFESPDLKQMGYVAGCHLHKPVNHVTAKTITVAIFKLACLLNDIKWEESE